MHGLKGDYMNRIVINNRWKVHFDKAATALYYENYTDLCQCASCRNFYQNTDRVSADIRNFIEQFGADVTKPIEQESVIANKEQRLVEYTLYYAVNGTIDLLDEFDMQIGKNSIGVISKEATPNTDISEPYFVFAVYDIWLPWTVDDSIDESYD